MSRERFNAAENRFWTQQATNMAEAGFDPDYAAKETQMAREHCNDEAWLQAAGFGNDKLSPRTDFLCWYIQTTNLLCYLNMKYPDDEHRD